LKISSLHIAAAGIFVLLKYLHTCLGTDDLYFLLAPVNRVVALVTNSQAIYTEENGYFHAALNIYIDKSCSGFNFWILCFMIGIFRAARLISWLITVFVNASRILTAIFLQQLSPDFMKSQQHWAHQTTGIFIYLFFLLLFYWLFDRTLVQRKV
jgi:exosortase/archaeosortase family protein